jgi:peroxiredoxin 2/4
MMDMLDSYEVYQPLVGNPAPSFTAQAYLKAWESAENPLGFKQAGLDDYKGRWLVLFFYPLDFTFVCPTEITAFNERLGDFESRNAQLLGCSIDSQFVHKAWVERGDLGALNFPLVADLTKDIAADYGILTKDGFALRGLFIVDPKGVLQYAVVHNTDVGRNVDETLRVLDALQCGGLCPANWKKGEQTLG